MRFQGQFYGMEGEDLARIWQASEKLCNGEGMNDDARRDMGQLIQALLNRAMDISDEGDNPRH